MRGELAAHAFAPYVGDAVALGVGGAHPGMVGQVDAHAVGGAQARTLADQYGDRFGIEDLTDLIAHGHPALFDDHHGRNAPSPVIELREHRVEERHGVLLDGESGEPVGDDEGRIEPASRSARPLLQPAVRIEVKPAALVGTLQIDQAVARGAVQRDDLSTALLEGFAQRLDRERVMHGVPGSGVRELEFQVRPGRQARSRAPQCDSRPGELAQRLPGIRDGRVFRPVHRRFVTPGTTARAGKAAAASPKDAGLRRARTRRRSAATPRIPARASIPAPGARRARRGTRCSGS